MTGERLGLCAESPNNHNTLRDLRPLYAPRYLINLRIEPRASSLPTPDNTDDVAMLYRRAVGWWVYPGCVGKMVYIQGGIPRVYREVYTTQHASLGVYIGVYLPSMPPWCVYQVYLTQHASLVYILVYTLYTHLRYPS